MAQPGASETSCVPRFASRPFVRLAVVVAAASLAAGCVKRIRTDAVPPAPAGARPSAAVPEALPTPASRVVAVARSLVGTPYRQGGADPSGFDCSGFVQFVFGQLGVALPRGVREQASAGERVDRRSLRDGDLVFFAIDGRTISHVGIVSGADAFVHAPSSRGVVREESLRAPYWDTRLAAARRVLTDAPGAQRSSR